MPRKKLTTSVPLTPDILRAIQAGMITKRVEQKELAKELQIEPTTLSQYLSRGYFSISLIREVEKVLSIDLSKFLK